MKIIIGKTAGFCFGVSNAVNKTEELLKTNRNIFCLGELVHNKQVTDDLSSKGLNIINNIDEAKENIIIRAHGVPKEIYQKAEKLKLNIKDLTCPKVLKIHKLAKEYSNNGYYIFLIGQSNHPETVGTISYCGENSDVIEDIEEIDFKLNNFYDSGVKKLLILSQTTYSLEKFENIIETIKKKIEDTNINIEIINTICNATKLRQEETKQIAKDVELMIIIGGKHSSNTNKLYQIANQYCKRCLLIENEQELDIRHVKKVTKIGIMAGASTPKKSIEAVVEKVKQMC